MENIIGKSFKQNCGDTLKVLEKTNKQNKYFIYLYRCVFEKYPYETLAIKQNIEKGQVINPLIEQKEFVEKIWPQHCGDSLRIIKKTEEKIKDEYLWEVEFINYPFKILTKKAYILKGAVKNPLIKDEFEQKIWSQHCGDSLRIIKKSDYKKENRKEIYYECEFIKYPYKVLKYKQQIVNGSVINPLIEEIEFFDKIWFQKCGDSLKVFKEDKKRINKEIYYKCKFQNYFCEVFATKGNIMKGGVLNPLIEENKFIGKLWKQECGDILKILEKSKKYNKSGAILWKVQFQKHNFVTFDTKTNIIKGKVKNPFYFPWENEEIFKNILINQNPKFNLQTLLIFLNKNYSKIAYTTLVQLINKYNFSSYIDKYSYSFKEQELKDYIQNFVEEKIGNSWSELNNGQEIDVYIPSKKIGFEFNGTYWHSEIYKDNNYHQQKSLLAKEKNINLFHIWEWEWDSKQNILKSIIKSHLGIFDKKIFARKCKIKNLSNQEYQEFCNENHLQGECGAKIKLGLFYKDELIQIMSFGSPRFTSNYEWEIIRECSKLGHCIIGGKEKLWSHFLKNWNPKNCISYCDFSKFDGHSYLKLGFKKERLNKPGFVWWDEKTNEIYWRNPCKHEKMKEKYLKIYDAGQLVFSWFKEN